mmetsp:Transcript_15862/g.49136  ORF Transcript_15862/g.49136 Transcript_15862/m.49136 type:complete len:122 (+) Transcript_15862:496-861(+)
MVMQPTHGDHEDPEVEKLVRDAARVTSRVTAPRRLRTNASYALQTHPSWKIAHGGRDVLSRHQRALATPGKIARLEKSADRTKRPRRGVAAAATRTFHRVAATPPSLRPLCGHSVDTDRKH